MGTRSDPREWGPGVTPGNGDQEMEWGPGVTPGNGDQRQPSVGMGTRDDPQWGWGPGVTLSGDGDQG